VARALGAKASEKRTRRSSSYERTRKPPSVGEKGGRLVIARLALRHQPPVSLPLRLVALLCRMQGMTSKGWLTSVLSGRKGKDGTDAGLVSVQSAPGS